MKAQKITAIVTGGHLPMRVRQQLATALKSVKDGTRVIVELREWPKRRTLLQNDGFHAMISPWAKDEGHDIADLKKDLLGIIFGWDGSPLGESRVPKKPHTSDLSVEEFHELIERTAIIAAQNGYLLELPSEYSERIFRDRSAS